MRRPGAGPGIPTNQPQNPLTTRTMRIVVAIVGVLGTIFLLAQVGMPNITNFTERKFAKSLLELRDTEGLTTWTYIVDMHGELHFLTESIGYGLPYSVQFTNPERSVRAPQGGDHTLPQADPNGLFMPDGLSATWILASTADGPKPIYVEPQIIVSPIKLH